MGKVKKVECGDWYLGWGFGGHNKLGKLETTEEPDIYIWKGHAQGRHGQILHKRTTTVFSYIDGEIKIISGHLLPQYSEVIKAIDILHYEKNN